MSSAPPFRAPPESLGPFRLLRPLGEGGFAPVWLAEEMYDGKRLREVAVKLFFLPEMVEPASAEAAWWRDEVLTEARALCRVEHPNVVRFYSLQRDDALGVIGLVMERVPGRSLDRVLHEEGPLSEKTVLDVGISIAWALAAVHNAGLVHADIKPGNIIQSASAFKLIDFGIVLDVPPSGRALADSMSGLGASGSSTLVEPLRRGARPLAGTPGYVAPECLERGVALSPSSDLYALGVTLARLATGATPAPRGAPFPTPNFRAFAPVRGPQSSVTAPQIGSLTDMTAMLMSRDPRLRPRHADWVAGELERLRAEMSPRRSVASLSERPSSPSAIELTARPYDGLRALRERAPETIRPLLSAVIRACERDDLIEAGGALGELAVGVLRHAFALGMAVITAEPSSPPAIRALVEQLQSAARPTRSSWCYLARAVYAALVAGGSSAARLLAFTADPKITEDIDAFVRVPLSRSALAGGARWIEELFEKASELLSISITLHIGGAVGTAEAAGSGALGVSPLAEDSTAEAEPRAVIDDRRITLAPWLLVDGQQILLPEAPAAPGKPWRATNPATSERRDSPLLDQAVRKLIEGGADMPREPIANPPVVGRADVLALLERATSEAERGSARFVLLTGPLGVGRTRLMEAAIAQAGWAPHRVLRLRCSPERRSPLRPLIRALEELPHSGDGALEAVKDAIDRALGPTSLPGTARDNQAIEGVEDALLWAAARTPLALSVDDVQWADAQTLSLLKLLVERSALGASARLFVIASARDEPSPSPLLRVLLSEVRGKTRASVKHVALGPLDPDDAAALAQAICPLDPDLERVVVRGSGGVPFFVHHAICAWREGGYIAWRRGAWTAVSERVLCEDVPGVADLLEGRLASYFEPNSPRFRAGLRVLSAIALYGGGLGVDVVLRVAGEEESTESALEVLVEAGIVAGSGEGQELSFAQEMVRQAVLNMARQRPWFHRLYRALLDAIAEGPSAETDARFLAAGYEKLGVRDRARAWFRRAMDGALSAGLFSEAAALGERLAVLMSDPPARADVAIEIIRALVRARRFEEAKAQIALIESRDGVFGSSAAIAPMRDVRRRILKLEVARGLSEPGADADLVADADALGDVVLRCEARIALAGVAPRESAIELCHEAVALGERAGPACEFAARSLRVELSYPVSEQNRRLVELDLERELVIATALSSKWQRIIIEGDLAVLEAEVGRLGAAIERLTRLVVETEEFGMRAQLRLFSHNLSTCLMRAGRSAEAAEAAKQTAELSAEAGDPALRAASLSMRAFALRHTGDFDAALACADEAEQLQRERGDRMRAQTLLRRAEILDAMGRRDDAMTDARAAEQDAERHGEKGFAVTSRLWQALFLATRGEASASDLERAIEAVEASGVGRRALAQRLIEKARAWLGGFTAPPSFPPPPLPPSDPRS